MCKGMLGKKIGMTTVFASDGRSVPVTVIQVGPCVVTQVKSEKTDGYNALQLGFDEKAIQKCNRPEKGHFAKSGNAGFAVLREFEVAVPEEYDAGQAVTIDMFSLGERISVSGVSKGRGFAGTIKRYGFGRGPETHGSRNHRAPGSVGCSAWPARIVKGKKMPGHLGVDRKTIKNLEIVDIRPEENLLLIKGAVPGAKTGILEIKKRV
ncbi:MAG: 50S ribosomal protein L3 [Thermodesulfobacteriota bacterium]|nr:50S ribosomal protein L3 [Thermodesulfobacteriota bacterium]